jgi:hypothetical protein
MTAECISKRGIEDPDLWKMSSPSLLYFSRCFFKEAYVSEERIESEDKRK